MQTGLLMTLIRSLTASRDTAERDREKANLQQEFSDSDGRLDKLILKHHDDLTSVAQEFSKISTRLHSAKDGVQRIREKLVTCQKQLHCKRDELKRLWLESVENKQVLKMLDQVESMSKVPNDVRTLVTNKQYTEAIKLCTDSLALFDDDLRHIDALREVKAELIAKKEEITELLQDDSDESKANRKEKEKEIERIEKEKENLNMLTSEDEENALGSAPTDLNAFFQKKATLPVIGTSFNKSKKCPLFRFDWSSHAMSLNAYLREQEEMRKTVKPSNDLQDES